MFRKILLSVAVLALFAVVGSQSAEARGCYRGGGGGGYYPSYRTSSYYGGGSYYGNRHHHGSSYHRSSYGPSYGHYPYRRSGVSLSFGF